MKITLIDRNTDIVMAWEKYFHGIEGVENEKHFQTNIFMKLMQLFHQQILSV